MIDFHAARQSPRSLWSTTAAPAPPTRPLDGDADANVAIVGAGYTGLTAAVTLAESGRRPIVLEAGAIGAGASGRNNGQVIPTLSRGDPEDFVRRYGRDKGRAMGLVVRDSAESVFALIRRHGIDCEAIQNGWIQPAHRPSRLALSRRRVEQWSELNARVRFVDADEAAAISGSRFWYGGMLNPTGGHINPLGFARGLAAAARRAGAEIFTETPALSIEQIGDRWSIGTPKGRVVASMVILATNAYTGELWPDLGRSVLPVRSYQLATAPLSDNVRRTVLPGGHALSDTQGDLHFFRLDSAGRLVTGAGLVLPIEAEARLKRRTIGRIRRVFPQIGDVDIDYFWHGYIGMTPDRLPMLLELAPRLYAWTGCNGRGVALAVQFGGLLAEAALGRPLADLPWPEARVRPLPWHGLVRRLARLMLLLYRFNDRRD